MPMAVPALDANVATALIPPSNPMTVAVSPFVPGVLTHAPMHHPTETVGTPNNLYEEAFSHSYNYYSHSNNSTLPMVVPTPNVQLTSESMIGTPVRPTLLHDAFNAESQFVPGMSTQTPSDHMRIHKWTRHDDAMGEALALMPINNLLGAVAVEWD
eukprot:scaffold30220_cov56-Attheya_sp.AAC.2